MEERSTRRLTVAITGSNGFVGGILRRRLARERYHLLGFDQFDGPLYRLLTKRHLQPLPLAQFNSLRAKVARRLWFLQKKVTHRLIKVHLIRPRNLNILDVQSRWIKRFRGVDAVVHLAAIPHPGYPGMRPVDFEIINYWGAVNIFEAAAAAGVKRFVFASSGQVYDINRYKNWTQFPVREQEADRVQKSTPDLHPYNRLKWRFENYLAERAPAEEMTAVSLRLEYPGIWSGGRWNLWTQCSVENLVDGFDKALRASLAPGGHRFNLCNAEIPAEMGEVAKVVAEHWPDVPNHCTGRQALLDTTAAREQLGYAPQPGGTYYLQETVF
jgi:nucleoside-diphosphate-sugar epimerase